MNMPSEAERENNRAWARFILSWFSLSYALRYGPCPNCGDGPCREETADVHGWPDLGFSEGMFCNDRPFKDEQLARAFLNDRYFCTGSELLVFWRDGKILWLTKRLGVTEKRP